MYAFMVFKMLLFALLNENINRPIHDNCDTALLQGKMTYNSKK